MRLFAALELPAPVREHLAAALPAGPRYVPPERWHLTLAFYGELGAAGAARLAERLARAAGRSPPLDLSVDGAGRFAGRGQTVLWCGVTGDLGTLRRLAAACRAAGERVGVPPERRRFRAHVTLARVRTDPDAVPPALADYRGPRWTARELLLVRSHLGPEPRYQVLGGYPLGRVPPGDEPDR